MNDSNQHNKSTESQDDSILRSAAHHDQAEFRPVGGEEEQVSLLDVLLILVRNRRLIGITVLVFGICGLIIAVIPEPPVYESTATLIREGEQQGGGASSAMLNRFGIRAGGEASGLTAQIYPEVLATREVRLSVVRDTFYISRWDSTVRLVDYLNQPAGRAERILGQVKRYTIGLPATIEGLLTQAEVARPAVRVTSVSSASSSETAPPLYPTSDEESAMSEVRRLVSVRVTEDNGLMFVSARTDDPRLSPDLVESFIHHLEARIREMHTAKSHRNLEFVRSRFQSVEAELREAEEALARFIDRNSAVQSARLITERERLQRQVQFKTELYTRLQSELTQAEIELQRSEPVITVLEEPVPPRGPSNQSSGFGLLLAIVFGLLAGCGLAFARAFFEEKEKFSEDKEKIDEIRAALPSGSIVRRMKSLVRNGDDVSAHERNVDVVGGRSSGEYVP